MCQHARLEINLGSYGPNFAFACLRASALETQIFTSWNTEFGVRLISGSSWRPAAL